MEITLGGRMGGPETGVRFLSELVRARPQLQAALADVSVPHLELVQVEMWISGSLTDYRAEGIVPSARYSAKQHRLRLTVAVSREDVEAVSDECTTEAFATWLIDGFTSTALPRSAQALEFSRVIDAVTLALR